MTRGDRGRVGAGTGQGGDGEVAGHQHLGPGGDARLERRKLDGIEPPAIVGDDRHLVVGIDGRLALAGKGRHSGRLQPFD
jgi:hypothetical protein